MRIKNILLIVLIPISCKAFAFNGDEHKKLADMAFKVAFDYLSLSCDAQGGGQVFHLTSGAILEASASRHVRDTPSKFTFLGNYRGR